MFRPVGVELFGGRVYVADSRNHRVLIWNGIPSTNGAPADRVIGQSVFTTATIGSSSTKFSAPQDVFANGSSLLISDYGNHRVLIFPNVYPNNGDPATFVIGHDDLTENGVNDGGTVAADTLNNPSLMAMNGTDLYVADTGNNRILKYSSIPVANKVSATQVFGQPDFTSNSDDDDFVTSGSLDKPSGITVAGGKMVISDTDNNRVKFYDSIPSADNPSPDSIRGQSTVNGEFGGDMTVSASIFEHARLHVDANNFIASNSYSNRILIWNQLPQLPLEPADVVLGQNDFVSRKANAAGTVSASSLNNVSSILVDQGKLLASDTGNHRVLLWNTILSVNNSPASFAIGQPDLTSDTENQGLLGANSLSRPSGLFSVNGKLIVCDSGNHRVLVYNSFPSASNASANLVLGQAGMISSSANRGGAINSDTLNTPISVWSDGVRLAISDAGNNRILLWDTFPTTDGQAADHVIGQTVMTSGDKNLGQANTIQGGLNYVSKLSVYQDKLLVADRYNNRILVWNSWPTADGQLPDQVLFQENFESCEHGVNESKFSNPIDFHIYNDAIYISDRGNYRIFGVPLDILEN